MNPLPKIQRTIKRNLWQHCQGFIYHQTPKQIQIPDDFSNRHDPPLELLEVEAIRTTETWSGLGRTETNRRLAKGDLCYGHQLDNEIVSILWISSTSNFIRGVNLLIDMADDEWYCYGIMTKPSVRGQGLYKLAQRQIVELAQEQGIQNLIAYVEAQNLIPQKIYQRLDYQVTPSITARRVFGVQFGNRYDSKTGTITQQLTNTAKQHHNWI